MLFDTYIIYISNQGSACAEPRNPWVPGGTHRNFKNMGSGGFRVPGRNQKSGFRVPVSNNIHKKVSSPVVHPIKIISVFKYGFVRMLIYAMQRFLNYRINIFCVSKSVSI